MRENPSKKFFFKDEQYNRRALFYPWRKHPLLRAVHLFPVTLCAFSLSIRPFYLQCCPRRWRTCSKGSKLDYNHRSIYFSINVWDTILWSGQVRNKDDKASSMFSKRDRFSSHRSVRFEILSVLDFGFFSDFGLNMLIRRLKILAIG